MQRKIKSFDGVVINYNISNQLNHSVSNNIFSSLRRKNLNQKNLHKAGRGGWIYRKSHKFNQETYVGDYISKLSDNFLIFLHGAGLNLTSWKKERRFFYKKGFSTLAIDLRGHGLSGRPNLITDYNLENFAKDVYAVIKKEKIQNFVMVGHSLGVMIAIIFHKLYPNLSKGYVFIDPTYKAPKILKKFVRKHHFILYLLNNILSCRNLNKKKFPHANYDKYVGKGDMNLRRIYSDVRHTSFRTLLFIFEKIAEFNAIKILKNMNKPVLIISSEKDSIFDISVSKKLKKLIKCSKLDIIPNEDHSVVLNNPKILEEGIYNFMQKNRKLWMK